MTTLHTDRLTLRAPVRADAARIAALVGDLDVSRWVTHVPHPYSEADALDFIDRFGGADRNTYLICRDGDPIGVMGLDSELGYWLGAAYWGHGYATEAARALLDRHFAASEDGVRSGYHVGNDRSANVLTKLGFLPAELARRTVRAMGRTVSVRKMDLSAARWREGSA